MQSKTVWEGDTDYGHYEVVDGLYDGRPARVLYSGGHMAAQSGVPRDNRPEMLFDYNQRLLELATTLSPKNILLIGGGVGTLPTALLAAVPTVEVTMVEPDRGLTKLGYQLFDLPVSTRLSITHTDGRSFLAEHTAQYEMVIIDAFNHTTIPADLKTVEAFRTYKNHLRPNGVLAMNVISGYYGPSAQVLRQMFSGAMRMFGWVDAVLASSGYSLWLPQNFIVTAHNIGALRTTDYMRARPVDPPELQPGDVVHDQDAD